MNKIYRIIYKFGIFGYRQGWFDKPIFWGKEIKPGSTDLKKDGVACVEYVQTEDAELTGKDIEMIENMIEEANFDRPDYPVYNYVAAEFNRKHFNKK